MTKAYKLEIARRIAEYDRARNSYLNKASLRELTAIELSAFRIVSSQLREAEEEMASHFRLRKKDWNKKRW